MRLINLHRPLKILEVYQSGVDVKGPVIPTLITLPYVAVY